MTPEDKHLAELCNAFFDSHPELPRIQQVWGILCDYLFEKQITVSLSNFEFAFQTRRIEIEKALDAINSDEWKREVVLPQFSKRQKDNPPSESRKPLGVKWSNFLNQ